MKTLVIIIMTVSITVPCIRLGGVIAKTSEASGTVHQKTDSRPEVEIRGERLTVSFATMDTGSNSMEEFRRNRNGTLVDEKHRKRAIGESERTSVFRDDHSSSSFGFPTSRSRGAPYSIVRSLFITPDSIDRLDNKNTAATNIDNGNHKSNINSANSRINHRQLNNYDDSSIQTNTQTAKKDSVINNYQNTHDRVSIKINKGFKESAGDLKNEKDWTTISKPEQIFSESTETTEDSNSRPPLKLGTHYSANGNNENQILSKQAVEVLNEYYSPTYGTYYGTQPIPEPDGGSPIVIPNVQPPVISQPPTVPQPPVIQPPNQTVQRPLSTGNNGNWQRLGLILALVKLAMVKIKAIGFLKPFLLLLFKLKFTMAVLFFKFLLSLKLLLFFKLQVLPLILVTSLPILMSLIYPMFMAGLFSFPGQIINTILGRVDTVAIPASAVASDVSNPLREVANTQNPIPDTLINSFGSLKGRSFNSRELLDPTLDFFQKALGSEKCVARIACEIALAEKFGIIPTWMNEVSRQVTTLFPNKISEEYLKTYIKEKDEMHTKMPSLDIWTTKCLENYGCNNIDTTNTTDKNQ